MTKASLKDFLIKHTNILWACLSISNEGKSAGKNSSFCKMLTSVRLPYFSERTVSVSSYSKGRDFSSNPVIVLKKLLFRASSDFFFFSSDYVSSLYVAILSVMILSI